MKFSVTRRCFIRTAGRLSLAASGAYGLSSLLGGCVSKDVAATLSQVSKYSGSVVKVARAGIKAFDDFTPEQEYYIGRTVGAVVLQKYPVYENTELTQYINLLGQSLAQASDLPETFNGYHLLVLDSDDINAFAAPSGFIFVTRGMLRCCGSEDELAAVLSHEIGHVQLKHGLQAIRKGRFAEFGSLLALETTKALTDAEVSQLVESFEGTISDITTTLINGGYSRSFEKDADESAMVIMERVGYQPAALITMLETMEKSLRPEGLDFARTHPSPRQRIAFLEKRLNSKNKPHVFVNRQKRFAEAMRHV